MRSQFDVPFWPAPQVGCHLLVLEHRPVTFDPVDHVLCHLVSGPKRRRILRQLHGPNSVASEHGKEESDGLPTGRPKVSFPDPLVVLAPRS